VYYRKPSGRPTREADNLRHAFSVVLLHFADLPADEFKPTKLRHCQQAMIDDDLARSTINARVNRIRRVFRWAVSLEMITAYNLAALEAVPPLKHGRTSARETSPITAVPWEHVLPVINELRAPTRCIVEVLWWTGMRVSEALSMRPIDIDRDGEIWTYTPREHKCEHYGIKRIIPLGPRATAVVQRRLDDLAMLLFPDEQTHVFEFSSGRIHTTDSLRNAVQKSCDLAGVPLWTPLQLRHAAATRLRDQMGLEASRVVLGHSSAATTEIYAEIDRQKARSLMEQFG